MTQTGGVFFREGDGIDAKKLIAKVCDGGRVTTGDARTASGTELVGFAVHAPRNGFWAIVDSADGALGIEKGDWSKVSIAANHMHTDAIWYRTYAIDLALAVWFPKGGTWMRAYVGIADDIITRLEAEGLPVHESQPPATSTDALLAAVEYEPGRYASGPSEAAVRKLVGIHEALVDGDADALRLELSNLGDEDRALALAVIRGADRGAWKACITACARQIVAEPVRLRVKLGNLTPDEELLRRACELADEEFLPILDRLDEIEADAGARSSHSHPLGVTKLAYQFSVAKSHERELQALLRLLRRPKPGWSECNHAMSTLLKRSPFVLDDAAREAIRLVDKRLPDLGQSAIDSITYNLACVYSRAGELDRALVELRRCVEPRKQNAHPEQDTDFEPLWNHPEFQALIAPPKVEHVEAAVVEAAVEYQVPPEHAVPRFVMHFEDGGEEGALIDRIGGKPNAPSADFTWPISSSRPMDFVIQLVGKAAGGAVELGDIHVLQIFADLEGEFYEPGEHAVIAHRAPCTVVVEPPVTVTVADVRTIQLTPGFDDRRLLDDDFEDDDARTHSWEDKVFGVPVGANLDLDLRDEDDEPMRLILELMSYDDYFLWALFAKQDLSSFRLEIVRG